MTNAEGINSVHADRVHTVGGHTIPVLDRVAQVGSGCDREVAGSTSETGDTTGGAPLQSRDALCADNRGCDTEDGGHTSGGDGGSAEVKVYNEEGLEVDSLTGEVKVNSLLLSFGWLTMPQIDDPDIDAKIEKIQERMGDRLNAAATVRQNAERKARIKERSAKTLERFFGVLLAEHARRKRETEHIRGKTVDYDYLSVSFTKTGGMSVYDRNALDFQLVTNPELAKKMGIEIKTVQTPVYKPEDIYAAIKKGKVKASELRGLRTDEVDEYGKYSFKALEVR